MTAIHVVAIVIGGVLGFALFWSALLWLLAIGSGWRALAQRFPAPGAGGARPYTWVSAAIGRGAVPVSFNNILRVTIDRAGLRFAAPIPVLGPAFRPFLLRWDAIRSVTERSSLLGNTARVEIVDWSGAIALRGAVADAVLATWSARRARPDGADFVVPPAPAGRDLRLLPIVGVAVVLVLIAALVTALVLARPAS